MARGQPTKYKPEYCDMLAAHFEGGYSYESFAGVIGVAKRTLYHWEEANPEFLQAKKASEAKAQLVWEKRLASLASTGEGNATAVIFGLKNRAPESWRDRQEVAHDVTDPMKELLEYVAGNGKRIGGG